MPLGALKQPESLVYNAPKDIGIRPIFVKLQYKTSASYTVIGDTEKYRYFLCTTVRNERSKSGAKRRERFYG